MIVWLEKHKREFSCFLILMAITLFVRFYKLDSYMTFLGDEGRDAIIVKKILLDYDLPFIGPPTSVGNIYLGPLYYYMMVVPMALFWLNPVAAAGMIAIIGTFTVALVYFFARDWFGTVAAFISALLYSLSPINILYSKSSWNPNPAPFFSLVALLGLYLARKRKNFFWLILTGASLAFALQMHYLAIILLPIYFLLWVYEFKYRKNYKGFYFASLLAFFVFLALMSPLIVFDLRHNFMNYRAFTTLFFSSESVGISVTSLANVAVLYPYNLVARYMAGGNVWVGGLLSFFLLLPFAGFVFGKRNIIWHFGVLGLWLVVGILGLTLYRQEVYPHYMGFLNPAPYLLFGALVKKFSKVLIFLLVAFLTYLNISQSPLKNPPNNQLAKTQEIAKFVVDKSEGKPFNFALIARRNYDAAYQYYLDLYGSSPKVVPFDVTEQLFVVCEDPICRPVGHPKYEIAGFGPTILDREYEIEGLKIYRLVHNYKLIYDR